MHNGYSKSKSKKSILEYELKNGKKHGLFAEYFPNGKIDFGLWIEGKPIGIWAIKRNRDDPFFKHIWTKEELDK